MLVRNRMTNNPVTITSQDTLATAQKKMAAGQFRRLPVVQDEVFVGIVTDRDVRRHVGMEERAKVGAVMTENPITVSPLTTVEEAARLMLTYKIGGLPVLEDGKLVGIITTSDVLQAFRDMMGASTAGSVRIDLMQGAGGIDLTEAAQLVEELGGRVLGIGTYRDIGAGQPIFYLRLHEVDAKAVSAALQKKGYIVLGTHP